MDLFLIIFCFVVLFCIFVSYNRRCSYKKKNNKNKIAVCMWYDDGIKQYADIAKAINKKYCDLHGYDLIVKNERKLPNRQQQWECIPTVLDLVNENKYDYIVWIDADAVFRLNHTNFNLLDEYISDNEDKHFILSADVPGYDIINTGIFIVKSNDYTRSVLENIIHSECEECNKYNEFGHEQECMCHLYKTNLHDFNQNTAILPVGSLQSWHKANSNIDKEYDDSMVLHLAGVSSDKRYTIFKYLKENDYRDILEH